MPSSKWEPLFRTHSRNPSVKVRTARWTHSLKLPLSLYELFLSVLLQCVIYSWKLSVWGNHVGNCCRFAGQDGLGMLPDWEMRYPAAHPFFSLIHKWYFICCGQKNCLVSFFSCYGLKTVRFPFQVLYKYSELFNFLLVVFLTGKENAWFVFSFSDKSR